MLKYLKKKFALTSLSEELKESSLTPVFSPSIKVVYASGDFLYDRSGKSYLDFTSGIAVHPFGHQVQSILKATSTQLHQLVHVSNLYVTQPQIDLANKLTEYAEKTFKKKAYSSVFFSNSGTEANEAAIKFAYLSSQRIYDDPDKVEIVSCTNSFHGRTLGSLAITGQEKYRKDFNSILNPNIRFVDYNNINSLEKHINSRTVAFIFEPIQGEGGLEEIDDGFIKKLILLSKKYKFFIIADEVQSGLYRTGKLFASKSYPELYPDIITLSKSLGGGLPLGATIVSRKIHNKLRVGDHGSTIGGNPVACAASLAVLKKLHTLNFQAIRQVSLLALNTEIQAIVKKIPNLVVVGKGHLQGIRLPTKSIDATKVVNEARDHGLLILKSGSNTIRIAPALNCSPINIKKGMNILKTILHTHLK